ncbi:asparagine--tRNA ligase [candidate division LCP-89 bacterium B3_LCP]|uniref:Asparagine--tRNA ligase n=1 Tax=candidate division LCP-89 bacterium B3_LCP TaxID=2012998 RepID=A0A532V4L1_UNCL8|nr:MAG: asparagine--tRNA ligase [candidate division LCP-89 bacterium B3_LCP]
MHQTYISDIAAREGETVEIRGWLYNLRSGGKLKFLQVRDGTGMIQGVLSKKEVSEEVWTAAQELTQECSIIVQGQVNKDERAPSGFELWLKDLIIVGSADEYPITKKEHGDAFLLDHRHLWIRSRRQHAILRIRHQVIKAMRDFFDDLGFINLDAPIFTPNASEGTSTLFETDYFGDKAYLSQSGQLYMEPGCAAFGKVYCFGPTFRAEKSKTRKHLTEFWMLEPEVAYMDLRGCMELGEDMLCFIIRRVLERCKSELNTLDRDISKLECIQKPFPRIHYKEACEILVDKGIDFTPGDDFGTPDEEALVEGYDKPLLIHHFPAAIKAFYMKCEANDPETSLSVDFIAPEGFGEIIGGSQREDNLDILKQKIKSHDLPSEAFEWYLDVRRYGTFPHSGFGLGLERTIAWICGIRHIRETIPYPRLMHRLKP